jgi:UDP-N-acetylmuramyl-tripeptide synthetase
LRLSRLIETVAGAPNGTAADGDPSPIDPDIGSIHCRAQNVRRGGLFIAIKGFEADGHDYVPEALKRGAAAIVAQHRINTGHVPVTVVSDTRRAMAALAARFYGHPSDRLCVVGITGTNGKTTSAYLIERILAGAKRNPGVIGTINYRYAGKTFDNPVTTPESIDLQRVLADMVAAGVSHVVMEVSSHALDLHRIDGCHLDVGVFTNLSQDHLDYHGTMEAYWACKRRMFTKHLGPMNPKPVKTAVINVDDPKGRQLAGLISGPCITTGRSGTAAVRVRNARLSRRGVTALFETPRGELAVRSTLVGRHNLENMLTAAGAALALDIPLEAIQEGIADLAVIPGRLETIPAPGNRFIYVDYAHTPDALEHVIGAVKALSDSRIICVFGCGGDRDRKKRPMMGNAAARLCDLSVVTSDNPRTEPPMQIIKDILTGVGETHARAYAPGDVAEGFTGPAYVVEPDRRAAIVLALRASRPNDTILIAGKGHETYQVLGRTKIAFDDRRIAAETIARLSRQPNQRL